jgi:HEAT repeat protein
MSRFASLPLLCLLLSTLPVHAGDANAVPRLIERLQKDSDANVRRAAAHELGRLGPRAKAAIPALIAAFKDTESPVREEASRALKKIGEPAVEPLLEALKDRDEYVRLRAVKVLGQMGTKAKLALTPVTTALENEVSGNVREAARVAYFRIKYDVKEVIPMLTDADAEKRHYGVKILSGFTPELARPAVGDLCKLLRNEQNSAIKEDVVNALSLFYVDNELSAPDRNLIISTLAAALKDPDETVGTRVAVCLSGFGSLARSALPAIQQAYKTAKTAEFKEALEKTDARIRGKEPPKKQ